LTKIHGKTSKQSKRPISPALILAVIGISILLVGGLIVLSGQFSQVDLSGFPAKGAANAPVTMVEYSDYGCGHCQAFELESLPILETAYIDTGKVRFVVHPYYLGNPQMGQAAQAAWCAADQGKFFEYHHALFQDVQATSSPETLIQLAASLGLNRDTFAQCLSSGQHYNDVEKARSAAEKRGVNSTPSFYINNRRVVGNDLPQIQRIINQQLGAAQ
jgi:protein-disulfide isomerase